MSDPVHALQQEAQAALALREALTKLPGMDDDTVRDSIEGETGLHEALAGAAAILTDCEVMQDGLEAKIEEFEARLKRYKDRDGFVRAAIEQAMTIGNLKKHELPDCTLSLSLRGGGVVVTDEAIVPSRFWKPRDPEIDKAAIKAAIKDGETVPGASISSGSVSLTVRRA